MDEVKTGDVIEHERLVVMTSKETGELKTLARETYTVLARTAVCVVKIALAAKLTLAHTQSNMYKCQQTRNDSETRNVTLQLIPAQLAAASELGLAIHCSLQRASQYIVPLYSCFDKSNLAARVLVTADASCVRACTDQTLSY